MNKKAIRQDRIQSDMQVSELIELIIQTRHFSLFIKITNHRFPEKNYLI